MAINRRTVLKYGLGGAGLLSLGTLGLGMQGTVLRTPSGPLKALDTTSYSVLAAAAERLCPQGDGFPSTAELDIAMQVDGLLATLSPLSLIHI